MHLSLAREQRQLYTLNPNTATAATIPTSDASVEPAPGPPSTTSTPYPARTNPITATAATIPTSDASVEPAPGPPPTKSTSGPARTKKKSTQARMRTGPLPAALKARVLMNTSSKSKANKTPAGVTQPSQSALINDPPNSEPSNSEPPTPQSREHLSDSGSDTLAPSNPDSAPPSTDDMSVDEQILPAVTTVPSAPCDSEIQVRINSTLGVSGLVETSPPALLFVDNDERPDWLLVSIRQFLQHGPYYLCLGKVVDLFLAQEARLGYPAKVNLRFYIPSLADFANPYSLFILPYHLETGPPKLPCT
jgi:hypothetical protein